MSYIQAIIISIIEGITEFLPISSTGHMLLAEHFLRAEQSEVFLDGKVENKAGHPWVG